MNKLLVFSKKLSKGFTLIELLIVIAVLGILAAVILIAIDPIEQLSRGRDAGRKTTAGQIGRALQAYFTVNSAYPNPVASFTNVNTTNPLVVSGEIKSLPSAQPLPLGNPACTGGVLFGLTNTIYCYKVSASPFDQAVVYTKLESKSGINTGACTGPYAQVFYVYSTADGRAGIVLLAAGAEPAAGTSYTYC